MKKAAFILLLCITGISAFAQECDLPLGISFSDDSQSLPMAVRRTLTNKLTQILTSNDVKGDMAFNQFAIVPQMDIIDKHVVAGPPAKIVYNINLSLQVVDSQENTVLSTYDTDINAVGENEIKAYMNAVVQLAPQSPQLKSFISTARSKIVQYYDKNYARILQKSKVLSNMHKYDEALFHIMQIPECCNSYADAMEQALPIFQQYVDENGERLLMGAQAIWSVGNDRESAAKAAALLVLISPASKAYPKAKALLGEMKTKSEKATPWDFTMQVYKDGVAIEQQRIEAARQIGVAYGKGQQQKTTNLLVH